MAAPLRVLHVDDDPSFGDLAADLLERKDEQIEVVTERSAADGLDRLEAASEAFDCIVSDYDMPEQNGLEFLDAVRERHPNLPFILFTGKGSEEVASDAISAGATDYLQKGSGTGQYDLLVNRIRNAVEKYRSTEERDRVYQALETATQGIGIVDENDEYVYVNQAYAELYGYTARELRGEHWSRLYPVEERHRFEEEVLPLLEREGSWSGRSRGIRADGSAVPEQVSLTQLDTGGHVCVVQDISEQIERERELRQSQRRFDAMFDDPNILVGLLDRDGTLLDANDTAMEYVGTDLATVTGTPFWETPWWLDDARPLIREKVEQAARGEYAEYEVDQVDADGKRYSTSGVIRPVTNEAGDVISLIASARDVTDRVQREKILETIVQNTTTPLFMKNRDGEYLFVNQGFKETFGLEGTTVVGRTDEDLLPPEMAAEIRQNDDTVLETGEPIETEEQVVVDGDERIFLSSKVPVHDIGTAADPETPLGIFGIASDLTEQKRRQAELERIQERMEFALQQTNAVIWERDIDSGAITTHPDPCPILGATVETAAEFRATVHPDDREAVAEAIQHVIETGEPDRIEYRTAGQSDVEWVETDLELLTDDETGARLIGITRVITDRKNRERILRQQNRRFDQLASAVSHDLQTPLSAARGRVELAIDTGDIEHMEKALDALDRTDELRENLIEVLRSRDVVGDTEPIDLGATAGDVWETITAPDDASLVVDEERHIRADPSALRRLLENLLSNAVEHGPDDVTVHVGGVDGGFYVADDGPGIPPADRTDVFELGFSTKDRGGGVGLSSVREIVGAHGWTIDIEESTDGGARIEILTHSE